MKNLLIYEEFNWFGKPKELDKEITEIINDIKDNFDINNLSYIKDGAGHSRGYFFIYTYKGQSLKFGYVAHYGGPEGLTTYTWQAFLNDEYIRNDLSKKIIKSFYYFLEKEWDNKDKRMKKEKSIEQKNKLRRLKDAEGRIGNDEIDPLGEENWL